MPSVHYLNTVLASLHCSFLRAFAALKMRCMNASRSVWSPLTSFPAATMSYAKEESEHAEHYDARNAEAQSAREDVRAEAGGNGRVRDKS